MRYKEFHWLHIPSGESGTSKFSPSTTQFGVRIALMEEEIAMGVDETKVLRLVNLWNSSSDKWKYWI